MGVRTLQVEVLGAHGGLRGDFGVDLDRVQVVGVPGDVHVVPVVVVERTVGVAFDEVRAVAQVGDVVQVAGNDKEEMRRNGEKKTPRGGGFIICLLEKGNYKEKATRLAALFMLHILTS